MVIIHNEKTCGEGILMMGVDRIHIFLCSTYYDLAFEKRWYLMIGLKIRIFMDVLGVDTSQ
jgi:hypothetical protein